MTNIQQEHVEQILSEIIKLNPFDAVVIVKKINNCLTVEMINAKAAILSNNNTFEKGIPAKDFFHFINWDQFEDLFNSTQSEVEFFTIKDNEQSCAVYVQSITIEEEELYYSIVIRQDFENTMDVKESESEIAKHLLFVEHYVDPIISLDLDGTIIYTNHAATKKLLEVNSKLIGQNLFDIIDDEYKKQFSIVLKNTLEGLPMGMPKLLIKHKQFSQEPYNIKTFPTYWDNQVIGIHIMLKDTNDFFIADSKSVSIN